MKFNKLLLSIFLFLFSAQCSNCANIVYPKTKVLNIKSPVTFFVGNENPSKCLKINNEIVEIHTSGGFFHPVKLNEGENIFTISNGAKSEIYKITRPKEKVIPDFKEIIYTNTLTYVVKTDNAPLRAIPYDGGINRLEHFAKGMPLNIVGEYANFYKVKLARDDYAWIGKSFVAKIQGFDNSPARIDGFIYDETPLKRIFTLKLSKKVPYILSETRSYVIDENSHFIPYTNGLDFVAYNVKGYPENKYEFHINPTGNSFGYKAYYKNNKELVIEVKNFPKQDQNQPLKGLKITLDPGHGGKESGATGCLGDKEKDINLLLTQKLKSKLEKAGATVFVTRNNDIYVNLYDRVKTSQNNNSDIFISIHHNALPDSGAESGRSGTATYYFYQQSKRLADNIHKSLLDNLELKDDKVREASYAVIRNTESLAILLEIGYMINPEDNSKIITPEFQQKAADAIVKGLENYFNGTK